MTREERIKLIKHLKYNRSINADYIITDKDADEIIKALEQESCFNPDEWCHDCSEYDHDKHCCPRYNKVIRNTVEEMKQQTCEDAVNKQAAIDALDTGLWGAEWDKALATAILKDLPSVQPKTGHWIYKDYNWWCSECNEAPKTLGYVWTADFMTEHFKFCNHCGAKMNVTPESEDKE